MDGVRRLRFDPEQHRFAPWVIAQLAQQPDEDLAEYLSHRTLLPEFRAMLHAFVRSVIAPELAYLPFVQKGAYVRVHVPGHSLGTTFHSDLALGHGAEEENVWIPVTRATLYLVDLQQSERLRVDAEFERRARELAEPITLEPGEALLFSSRHVHGVPPHSHQLTLDFRITPRVNEHAILGCLFEALAAG
jgi:hypothetical protein